MKQHFPKSLMLYFSLLVLAIGGFFLTTIFPTPGGFYAFIAIAGLGGFGVSANIYYTKKQKRQLVCPTGSNCNAVITSQYSRFFGIPLEYLGMAYFATICITYALRAIAPGLFTGPAPLLFFLLSLGAFLFSLYLLFVQAFLLRQWCIWCILAAMLSLSIFFMSLVGIQTAISFFTAITPLLFMMQSLGFALGMGTSTAALFLFVKFLRDQDIDTKEANTIKGMSELIWFGLGLVLVSQFALYIGYTSVLLQSAQFIVQILALFGVAISGAVLLIVFAPFLAHVPFSKKEEKKSHASFTSIRTAMFVSGAIALSSWYFAFTANYLPNFSLAILLLGYGIVVILAVLTSLAWEHMLIAKEEQVLN